MLNRKFTINIIESAVAVIPGAKSSEFKTRSDVDIINIIPIKKLIDVVIKPNPVVKMNNFQKSKLINKSLSIL